MTRRGARTKAGQRAERIRLGGREHGNGAAPSSGRRERRPATLGDQSRRAACICVKARRTRGRGRTSHAHRASGAPPRLVLQLAGPRGVDQHGVMRGQLSIERLIFGSYRSGRSTPVRRLSGAGRAGDASKNANAATWPRSTPLIHPQHRTHEHVPGSASTITNAHARDGARLPGQHRNRASRSRSELRPRRRGIPQHCHPRPQRLLGQVRRDTAPQRRHRRRQPMLIASR